MGIGKEKRNDVNGFINPEDVIGDSTDRLSDMNFFKSYTDTLIFIGAEMKEMGVNQLVLERKMSDLGISNKLKNRMKVRQFMPESAYQTLLIIERRSELEMAENNGIKVTWAVLDPFARKDRYVEISPMNICEDCTGDLHESARNVSGNRIWRKIGNESDMLADAISLIRLAESDVVSRLDGGSGAS